jgi:CDP-paratose synthetase
MKNLLLTGATGFIGSHLCKSLASLDYDVNLLVRATSNRSLISKISDRFNIIEFDELSLKKFDIIIHLATEYGNGKPISSVYESNFIWPIKILEATSHDQISFINTDTFFSKGSGEYSYLSHYTQSKQSFLDYLRSQPFKTFNMQLEHVFGPNDNASKFLPSIIGRILQGEKKIELTEGKQKRDFIYISDVIDAYLAVIQNINNFEKGVHHFEIGTSKSHSIKHLVELIYKHSPIKNSELLWGKLPTRKGEFEDSTANIKKIKQLGWSPQIDLNTGIKKSIEFYKN